MENQLNILNKIAKGLKERADIRAKNIDNLLNWKRIEGYDNYSVSNRGEVRNDKTDRILKGRTRKDIYLEVKLFKDKKYRNYLIHRLVAIAFIENPLNKRCVDHINNDRTNNNVDNLRWATDQENNMNAKVKKNNTSGIKGVSFNKAINKWHAEIRLNKKHIHIGYYKTLEEATIARQRKAKELFGEYINNCELII